MCLSSDFIGLVFYYPPLQLLIIQPWDVWEALY